MFKIEMLPAGHGDSLLISYGDPDDPHYIMIDGGPYYTFRSKAYGTRKTISKLVRRLADAAASLELLVITHIDADHIEGAVKMLGARPAQLGIQDVWFNAWPHLRPQGAVSYDAKHGEMLGGLILQESLPWNAAFDGGAVAVAPEARLPVITLGGGMRLTLLSPTTDGLLALIPAWESVLHKEGLDPNDPKAALERLKKSRLKPEHYGLPTDFDVEQIAGRPFVSDDDPANGSSIAFVAEFEGKSCLFAGDAHPGVLEASIRRLLQEQGGTRLRLDAFKLPHHGSKNNLSAALLSLIDCPRYLVSSNGSYFGHPDDEAMSRILVHGSAQPAFYFNYRSSDNAVWADRGLQQKRKYEAFYGKGAEGGSIIEL